MNLRDTTLAAELDIKSPAYTVLKNDIVPQHKQTARDERTIEILCDKEEAEVLLDATTRLYPPAAPDIEKAIARARES